MRIGEVYRYSRPYSVDAEFIDGMPNYFFSTNGPGNKPTLDKGINAIREIKRIRRVPAVLISSSPHKAGSADTPWDDVFDPDNGHILYFGDNKDPEKDPGLQQGNKSLLRAWKTHFSPDKEIRARDGTPVVFFRRVAYQNRAKGNVSFQGFGIVRRVQLITQLDVKKGRYFANYVFDFTVLSLKQENERFPWEWINLRRDPTVSTQETNACAPHSWKYWVDHGAERVDDVRRRVSGQRIVKKEEQMLIVGSRQESILHEVYKFYDGKKHRFEALALYVTEQTFKESGLNFKRGWITPSSSDGGADYIGKIDTGTKVSKLTIIVLGQAKCEKPSVATSGQHIARTVARLKRGWIGVYVTTSFFSLAVQREVIEDSYPIMLINGAKIAEVMSKEANRRGIAIDVLLHEIDSEYDNLIQTRRPEEIILL